jgi:hypothetical protein
MYSFKEIQEVKEAWKLSVMEHQLVIAVLMGVIVILLGIIFK